MCVHHDHRRARVRLRALQSRLEIGDRSDLLGLGPHRPSMRHEIDIWDNLLPAVLQEIVEVRAAAGHLQAVDATVAAVIEKHDGELLAEHHRGRKFRVHHHV
jgi:hypothetical protein